MIIRRALSRADSRELTKKGREFSEVTRCRNAYRKIGEPSDIEPLRSC